MRYGDIQDTRKKGNVSIKEKFDMFESGITLAGQRLALMFGAIVPVDVYGSTDYEIQEGAAPIA